MIDKISALLHREGLVSAGSTLRYNFILTKGTCIVAEVSGTGGESYFVKFSEISDLEPEYRRLAQAVRHYHEFVPTQHGFYRQNQFNLIVSARVRHASVVASVISKSMRADFLRCIEQFFKYSKETGLPLTSRESHEALLNEAFQYLLHDGFDDSYLESIRQVDMAQPSAIAQHGDFVLNNFGQTRHGLFVFDWEDYGKVTIPGLDLATFIFSVTEFDAGKIREIMLESATVAPQIKELIRRCCAQISVQPSRFLQRLPAYLMIFLYLKRAYGPEVQNVARGCLAELVKYR
jgi:hypothetical protein